MFILMIIFGSIAIYYLGATYVISTRFQNEPKPLTYWQSITIFGFFIKMAFKHPYKNHRISGIVATTLLYQVFANILKVYYGSVYAKHPDLNQSALLAVAKRKFEEGIFDVYNTIGSLSR